MTKRYNARQNGAAIVLAMLLAALAATVAATLFADQQRWIRTVEYRRDQVQAQAIAMAGVQWARAILLEDQRTSTTDNLREPWAMTLPPIPLDNGYIRGSIVDAQGLLNINDLAATGTDLDPQRARITRLFAQRGGPVNAINAISDWVDPDGITRPGGAEDGYYTSLAVPGLTANAPLLRVSELSLVRGVNPRALAAILPFISALPMGTPLNLNTAPPEVLAAVIENIDPEDLNALVASRQAQPFSSFADFHSRLPTSASIAGSESLTVSSSYFYVNVEAQQGNTVARVRALVQRGGPGQWPTVVWQVAE